MAVEELQSIIKRCVSNFFLFLLMLNTFKNMGRAQVIFNYICGHSNCLSSLVLALFLTYE